MEKTALSNLPAGDLSLFVAGASSHLGSLAMVAIYVHLAALFVYYTVNLQEKPAEAACGNDAPISVQVVLFPT